MVQSVLATVGELSRVAGPILRPHVGEVLPLVILALQGRYTVAVATLGQVSLVGQQASLINFKEVQKRKFCCCLLMRYPDQAQHPFCQAIARRPWPSEAEPVSPAA